MRGILVVIASILLIFVAPDLGVAFGVAVVIVEVVIPRIKAKASDNGELK